MLTDYDADQCSSALSRSRPGATTCTITRPTPRTPRRRSSRLSTPGAGQNLRKKKKDYPPNEKPDIVKTVMTNMIVVPEMTGSIVGVYNSKVFTQVEIKPDPAMIGNDCVYS